LVLQTPNTPTASYVLKNAMQPKDTATPVVATTTKVVDSVELALVVTKEMVIVPNASNAQLRPQTKLCSFLGF